MAIGLEHLRGPSGEQWTGMSPPQQRSQYPQQKKSQAPQSPFGPQQTVQTSMGNFPNLQAYQQQQDAFVQQHLKNQAQYNQGLQSGQSPQRVPVMEAWRQAGENIQSGQYQGNPFQTGNVDAIMGMFGQYGIQAPQGFRDQLLQNLGQQSAPPMYQPQPAMGYPGGPSNDFIPKFTDPTTGLPYGQQPPMTYPGGPAGNQNVPSRTLMNPSDGVPYAPVGPQDYYTGYGGPSGTPKFTNPGTGLPYGQPAPPQMAYPGGLSPGYGPNELQRTPGPGLIPVVLNEGTRSRETVFVTPAQKAQIDANSAAMAREAQIPPHVRQQQLLDQAMEAQRQAMSGQRPRDLAGDWGFGDYGPEPPRTPDQQRMDAMLQQQAESAAQSAQHERSLREMQERWPWLEPVRRSNSPTSQVIGWRPRSGAAQAKPARTQGTPYRSGKK